MKCINCGNESKDNNNFCSNCGIRLEQNSQETKNISNIVKKNNNQDTAQINNVNSKKSVLKLILMSVGIVFLIGLIKGFIFICLLTNIFVKTVDGVKDKINDYEEKEESRNNLYDSIPNELFKRNLISSNLKFVGNDYGWSFEWVDKTDKWYFYINKDYYDKYKYYWLEDVDKSKYTDKYNEYLGSYGDYIFTAIEVDDLEYSKDIEYGNVHLKANQTYYLVQIYDESIYYNYISGYKDANNYLVSTHSNYKPESLSKEFIFYQQDNEWVIEELIR